jgi:hypothetical protein
MKYYAVYLTNYGAEIVGTTAFNSYELAMEVATFVAQSLNHTIKYIIVK